MTNSTKPSAKDIEHVINLLVNGYLTDIYSLQKVTINLAKPVKMSLRDILLIVQIGMEPEITSAQLSTRFRLSSPLLSTRITSLIHLNMVKQVEAPQDRRIHKLVLLSAGEAVYKEWHQYIYNLAVDILNTFPRENIDQMEAQIEFIIQHVTAGLDQHPAK